MNDKLHSQIFVNKLLSYFIFLLGFIFAFTSFFDTLWYFPNPDLLLNNTSQTFYDYIQNIPLSKIDYRIFIFMILFYPFSLMVVFLTSYSGIIYSEIFEYMKKRISGMSIITKFFHSIYSSLPLAFGLIGLYLFLLLFSTNNFVLSISTAPSIIMIVMLILLSITFTFLLHLLNNSENILGIFKKVVFFLSNIFLYFFLFWGIILIILFILFYLMGNDSDPIYYNIVLMGFFMFLISYYYYKKKEYLEFKSLKLMFLKVINGVYILGYIFIVLLLKWNKPEFFSKHQLNFGSGFTLSVIAFLIMFAALLYSFFVYLSEKRKIRD